MSEMWTDHMETPPGSLVLHWNHLWGILCMSHCSDRQHRGEGQWESDSENWQEERCAAKYQTLSREKRPRCAKCTYQGAIEWLGAISICLKSLKLTFLRINQTPLTQILSLQDNCSYVFFLNHNRLWSLEVFENTWIPPSVVRKILLSYRKLHFISAAPAEDGVAE